MADEPGSGRRPVVIDSGVPHSARVWTYWLGGKDCYTVDRRAGDEFRSVFPGIVDVARTGREFLGRVVRHLVREAAITQFLDIGTGLPTTDNTHEVAQREAPGARVVYVDNDPLVLTHARALLTSTPEGATDYVEADVHDPGAILEHAARTLDLDRPVAVTMMGVLAHVADYDEARSIVRRLTAGLPPGSHVAVRDGTDTDPAYVRAMGAYNASGAVPYHLRTPREVAGFLDGLEPVEPGVVACPLWRPALGLPSGPRSLGGSALFGGVGRRP